MHLATNSTTFLSCPQPNRCTHVSFSGNESNVCSNTEHLRPNYRKPACLRLHQHESCELRKTTPMQQNVLPTNVHKLNDTNKKHNKLMQRCFTPPALHIACTRTCTTQRTHNEHIASRGPTHNMRKRLPWQSQRRNHTLTGVFTPTSHGKRRPQPAPDDHHV